MKTYRILIACGSGIATSTVIADKVRTLCQSNGYQVKIQQTKVVEVEKMADDFDLIVASTRIPESIQTPSVFAINYLTGINQKTTDQQILDIIAQLEKNSIKI